MTNKRSKLGLRKRLRKDRKKQGNDNDRKRSEGKPTRRSPSVDKTYVKSFNSDSASSSSSTNEEQEYYLSQSPGGRSRQSTGSRRSSGYSEILSITEDLYFDVDSQASESDEDSVYYEIVDSEESDCEEEDELEETEGGDPSVLPSPSELSSELCNLVFGARSIPSSQCRRLAFHSLVKLSRWVETKDPTFLKHFLTYGGVVKVLDFLQKILCEEKEHHLDVSKVNFSYRIAIQCIKNAATIIAGTCCFQEAAEQEEGTNGNQQQVPVSVSARFIAGVTATVAVDHGGIKILLKASDVCCRCYNKGGSTFDTEASQEASVKVWNAIANTFSCVSEETTAIMIEELFVFLWDGGFDAMDTFPLDTSSSGCPKANAATNLLRANVFRVFTRVLVRFRNELVKEKEAFEEDILSRVLEVLSGKKKNNNNNNEKDDDDASFASFSTGISSISMSFHSNDTISGTKEEEAYIKEALSFFFELQTQKLLFRKQKPDTNTTATLALTSTSSESSTSCNNNTVTDERWCRLCETLLPLCVNGLRKYAVGNETIRKTAIQILDSSLCSINKNVQQQNLLTELTEGTLEALGPCLASETLEETEKDKIKEVVRKIAVVIYSVYIGEFGPSGYNQGV